MSTNLPDELLGIEESPDDVDKEEPEEPPEERERLVVFELGDRSYAVHVQDVQSIVEATETTRVPRASAAIDGLIDIRGEITAVIDPRYHFDVGGEPAEPDDQRIVVFDPRADDQQVGLRVDRVVGVEMFPVSTIETNVSADDPGHDTGHDLVTATVAREVDGEVVERISLIDTQGLILASGQ